MTRAVLALAVLVLAARVPPPRYPAPYCGLVCPMSDTHQVCGWDNCTPPYQTAAD